MSLLIAVLLMLSQNNPKPPAEFYRLPEDIRERATVVFSGTYGMGRTPCMWRADGTRVWGLDPYFLVKRVYRGAVGSKDVRINTSMLPDSGYVAHQLTQKRNYLVLLQPSEEKIKMIKSPDGVSFWESLRNEEVLAIVEVR